MYKKTNSRRNFIKKSVAIPSIIILPRHVLGGKNFTSPSDKLDIASVGVGGRGRRNTIAFQNENIVSLCDVDSVHSSSTIKKFPKAKFYNDFRIMLEKQKNIDAVIISTPDHTHAVIASMAIKMGKHIFCEKPLTHTVYEARYIRELAKKYKVQTQMGNQGHSSDEILSLIHI